MRAYLPAYELILPATVAGALDLLAQNTGTWKPFAGGTDLMVLLESGKLPHKHYVNIWNLEELRGIEVTDSQVTLGALTTYTEVQEHPILQEEFPMLCQAAKETGGIAIQNRGTLGGNIVNASPAADSPPALLAYDAELEFVSKAGARRIPYSEFHTAYKQMKMHRGELLRAIRLPRNTNGLTHYFRKVGTRKAQAISKVCFAATGQEQDGRIANARIALGSGGPVPLRCMKTGAALRDQPDTANMLQNPKALVAAAVAPTRDLRST